MEIKKLYVPLEQFREDSYQLALQIIASGFYPDFMIALWRGGAIPGICMHEAFRWAGIKTDHIAIRTSKYTGIDEASNTVKVHSLGYVSAQLKPNSKVLIVDDIFDTGHSIEAVFQALKERLGNHIPSDIRVATIYYKPTRNQTSREPNYRRYITTDWVVFPHEVETMSLTEIEQSKGKNIADIFRAIQDVKPK